MIIWLTTNSVLLIIGIAVGVLGAAGVWWLSRKRKKRERSIISLVLLLREPVSLEPVVIAKTAGRAWGADLGEGDGEGRDGFVVGAGVDAINMIVHGENHYLFNCLPMPYVNDPESVADSIVDLRVRRLFSAHRAWLSCDSLVVDGDSSPEEIRECYRRLGRLMVELLDDNCLLVYVPDIERAYPVNERTQEALLSDDPLAALSKSGSVPVVSVPEEDAEMQAAVAKARRTWPQFVAAFETAAGENFSIKAPVTHSDRTEFIWLSVTAVEGDRVYGTLANDPADLGPLKLGSKVSVALAELNDWCYTDPVDGLHGLFTLDVVREAARRQQTS